MVSNYNKFFVITGVLLSLVVIVKYNKNIFVNNQKNTKIDKSTSISNLKNINKNNSVTQTKISLDKNETILVKETILENGNKWYDIIDENE